MTRILLTSFQTWLPHQASNAADDLLELLAAQAPPPGLTLHYLRQLPVETAAASAQTLAAIRQQQPDWVICCGMAERRDRLSLESRARCGDRQLLTRVPLAALTAHLAATEISHDAGGFVCEGLYFAVLEDLQRRNSRSRALFLHVPVLTARNQALLLADVQRLLAAIAAQPSTVEPGCEEG